MQTNGIGRQSIVITDVNSQGADALRDTEIVEEPRELMWLWEVRGGFGVFAARTS